MSKVQMYQVDEAFIIAALEKNPQLFKDIKSYTRSVLKEFCKKNPEIVLQNSKQGGSGYNEMFPDVIMEAVKKNPYMIELADYMPRLGTEITMQEMEPVFLAAVSKNGLAIKLIRNPSSAVQMAAVTNNPDSLMYINNPCREVIEYISGNRPAVLDNMEETNKRIEFLKIETRYDFDVIEDRAIDRFCDNVFFGEERKAVVDNIRKYNKIFLEEMNKAVFKNNQ